MATDFVLQGSYRLLIVQEFETSRKVLEKTCVP